MESKKTVRVLVVDDSAASLAALCSHLEKQDEIEVVGTAKNGFELLGKAQELQPDVVITDLHMPRMNGVECVLRLRELMPDTQFIVVTDVPDQLDGAFQPAGPTDQYFDRSASLDNVLDEIRRLFPKVFGRQSSADAQIENRKPLRSGDASEDNEIRSETSTGESEDPREASYC